MDKGLTIDKLYDMLKSELVGIVEGIESGLPTTQNRYGAYMGAINTLVDAFESVGVPAKVVGDLLAKAGGNVQGIRSALSVMGS